MQYRIPKIEGLEECKGLKVSVLRYLFINLFLKTEIGIEEKLD